jgi:acetyl-CoA acetyltransferase
MTKAATAIVGVGHSKVYRHDDVSLGALSVDACRRAIADAGLTPADIDGIVGDPMQPFDGAGNIDGRNLVTPGFLINALGLDVCWYEAVAGSTSRAIIEGVNAVASGDCKAVVAYRALHNPPGRYGVASPPAIGGPLQFNAPYGVFAPGMFSHLWTRYMHDYGTTRQQMAPFIVNNRKNALLWEHGYWYQHRPEPLTEDDYLSARMISSPIGMLDCDIPVQGCGAFVITSADRARDLPHKPAYVRGWAVPGQVLPGGGYMTELDILRDQATVFGRHLLENSGVAISDVDIVNVYDGFSIFVPLWLETLGFCGEGEAFGFMTPERISLDGDLPLNTSSGNLGAGRMHGVPHFMDSVLQIQGRSGPRQVRKKVDIALVTAGGRPGGAAGAVLASAPD